MKEENVKFIAWYIEPLIFSHGFISLLAFQNKTFDL